MALKQVAKLNGCHLPTVGREYKSRYLLGSRHLDLSSDAINFSCWHVKRVFLRLNFTKTIDFLSSRHFMAHYKSHHFTLMRTYFLSFSLVFVILIVVSVQIFTCQKPVIFPSLSNQGICRFCIKSSIWYHIFHFSAFFFRS